MESLQGHCLGPVTLVNRVAYNHRKRIRTTSENNPVQEKIAAPKDSIVELVLKEQTRRLGSIATRSFAENTAQHSADLATHRATFHKDKTQ